jgi:alcohol dehydrogenase (cytochrome c)
MMKHSLWQLFLCLALFWGNSQASAQSDARGKALYNEHCAECHSMNLRGSAHGSELRGTYFLRKWEKLGLETLFNTIVETMPPGKVGKLDLSEYESIYSYILAESDISNADHETSVLGRSPKPPPDHLTQTGDRSGQTDLEGFVSFSDSDTINNLDQRDSNYTNKSISNFVPVEQQSIDRPSDDDWLSWRRTSDGQGFSPLTQINKKNVRSLRLAWSMTMQEGSNQVTPIVSQGVMFLTHPGNVIQAIDAATGDLIWTFEYDYPETSRTLGGPTRNIAILGNKLFMATYDASLIAIDARTGKLIWKTVKADYQEGFTHTSGPIIANGIVVSGINGCERFVKDGCFITGHDPESGIELWRTSTIALANDPNSQTWGEVEPLYRAGGDTWIPGTYDPELNLVFFGTSQAKPWVAASRGMSPREPALYTNSTLALDPKTGEIIWYFQHVPGETIDMEVGFERILIDHADEGKVLYTIGKDGILWKLRRKDGQFLGLHETLPQNIYESINKKTGRLIYRKDILEASLDQPFSACPGIYGGHNWQAASYDKISVSLIIPMHQLCSDMVGREVDKIEGGGGFGGDSKTYEMPGVKGKLGKLVALDLRTMKEKWSHQQEAMFLTSSLSTAGGLTFIGDLDRYFKAFDSSSGKILWQTRLSSALHGFPITYKSQGKQFVSVTSGMGVFRALTSTVSPNIYQPDGGNAIYVFELP